MYLYSSCLKRTAEWASKLQIPGIVAKDHSQNPSFYVEFKEFSDVYSI